MTKTAYPKKKAEPKKEKESKPDLTQAVARAVLELLGRPRNLSDVRAVNVFGNSWRVNVICEEGKFSNKYTDCFFVTVSPKGEILTSSPEIRRKYDD
jgi:hypothetical protein